MVGEAVAPRPLTDFLVRPSCCVSGEKRGRRDHQRFSEEGLCRCFRRDQHLVGGGLKTGSNGPFVTKCGQCRSQRDKPLARFPPGGNFAVITAIVVCDGLETGYKSNRFVDLPHVLLRHTFPVHSDFRKNSFDLTKIGRRQLNVGCS